MHWRRFRSISGFYPLDAMSIAPCHPLPHTQVMTKTPPNRKDLLCSTGNYIQYPVITYNGKRTCKRSDMCMHIYIHIFYIYIHIYIYNWITLLYAWNAVNQLYFNKIIFKVIINIFFKKPPNIAKCHRVGEVKSPSLRTTSLD